MSAAVINISKNGQPVRSLTLDSSEAVLGRGDGCVIRLDDRSVSRQHAVLRAGPSGLSIEKKSRLAPLMVNGAECDSALLKEGDQILIGPYLIQIMAPPTSSSAVESADQALGLEGVDQESKPELSQPLEGLELSPVDSPVIDFQSGESSHNPEELQFNQDNVVGDSEVPQAEQSSLIGEGEKTRALPSQSIVRLKVTIAAGLANITSQEFDQDEVSIGRGKGCDIVLGDKKASRKHLVIRRSGSGVETSFVVKDLESANGVFVNGSRVSEHVLSGDDILQIGDTELLLQAVLPGYDQKEKHFLKIEEDRAPVLSSQAVTGLHSMSKAEGVSGIAGISEIPSAVPDSSSSKFNLMERYRALPVKSRVIWMLFVGVAIYSLLDNGPAQKKPAKKKLESARVASTSQPGSTQTLPSFDQLSPELKKFVDSQYNLALEYFRNRDYDRSIYEVRKIFQYVSDYRDARDLERYSIEGKQRLQAQEDEKRRRELEQANKARVAKLVIEVEGHMARKEYVQARELFAEIMTIEPDHPQVVSWRKEIEEHEERLRRDEQLKRFQQETLERARELLASGEAALRGQKWFRAMDIFKSVFSLDVQDKKVLGRANSGITRARAGVVAARDPHIQEGKKLESAGSYAGAFRSYGKALQIDPGSKEATEGAERVRVYLRDRARQLYTEAVLAESYSDYEVAKAKFQELLEVAPQDDPYHARAKRKLSRYLAEKE